MLDSFFLRYISSFCFVITLTIESNSRNAVACNDGIEVSVSLFCETRTERSVEVQGVEDLDSPSSRPKFK